MLKRTSKMKKIDEDVDFKRLQILDIKIGVNDKKGKRKWWDFVHDFSIALMKKDLGFNITPDERDYFKTKRDIFKFIHCAEKERSKVDGLVKEKERSKVDGLVKEKENKSK